MYFIVLYCTTFVISWSRVCFFRCTDKKICDIQNARRLDADFYLKPARCWLLWLVSPRPKSSVRRTLTESFDHWRIYLRQRSYLNNIDFYFWSIWPNDLEHVAHVALHTGMIFTKLKSANLSVITFNCWYVMSRCDLEIWPIGLERLQRIACHVINLRTPVALPNLSEVEQSVAKSLRVKYVQYDRRPPSWI